MNLIKFLVMFILSELCYNKEGDFMAIDGLFLNNISMKLNNILRGGKITRVAQPSAFELLLTIRSNRENHQLLISIHPSYARTCLTKHQYVNQSLPFVSRVKKYLEGSIVEGIETIGYERVIVLSLRQFDAIGDKHHYRLMIEVMQRHSNCSLIDEDDKIIDCMKHISYAQNTVRVLIPNAIYQLPPMLAKKDPHLIKTFDAQMSDDYAGISTLLMSEFLFQQHNLTDSIIASDKLYVYETKKQTLFHLIPLTHLGIEGKCFPLFDGLDHIFYDKDLKDRIKQQTNDLSKFIRQEIKKTKQKIMKLSSELDATDQASVYQENGDLLYAYAYLYEKGMKQIEVDDFYHDQKKIIVLDPKLSLSQNAQKYYQRYQKLKKGVIHLEHFIDKAKQDLAYFESLEVAVEQASIEEAFEIKQELEQQKFLKQKAFKGSKKQQTFKLMTFKSSTHKTIYVGKNNLQNDLLTFKIAHKHDTWLHVKDMAGSHVIIKGQDIDEPTLRLAAMLAAYYSKARYSSSIPVNYTQVKQLKKPVGRRPGQVMMMDMQTIYIDIDEKMIEAAIDDPLIVKK